MSGQTLATSEGLNAVLGSLRAEGFQPPTSPGPKWVGSVIPAALWSVAPTSQFADAEAAKALGLEPARQAVVIMVDGLGQIPLTQHLSYAHTLRSFADQGTSGQTVLPSTTAAALTAFGTGKLPGATRMVGYSVVSGPGRTMTLLNFEPETAPEQWQAQPTLFEFLGEEGAELTLITKPRFRDSGLTRAAFRGAAFVGRDTIYERFDAALAGLAAGAPLQVVYWADIDHTGHGRGVGSPQWLAALEEFDRALGRFLAALPSQVTVVMTADHGMVNVKEIIDVAETPALLQDVAVIAGEGRAVHLHAEPGKEAEVVQRWTDYLGGKADVVPAEEIGRLIGPGPGDKHVGAALVLARGRTVILDSRTQKPSVFQMVGVHGSYTREEMAIPIWRLA